MRKKSLAALLGAVLIILLVGYWLRGQERQPELPLLTLPPAQALGFIAFPGWPQAWSDVRASRFFQRVSSPAFWQAALGPDSYAHLSQTKASLEQQLGFPLTEQTVGPLLAREVGLALLPRQGDLSPFDVVAYVRVSSSEKLVEGLTRTFAKARQDVERETQRVEDTEIITLRPTGAPLGLTYTFLGNLAILSTNPAWVIDAIKAQHGTASDRLQQSPIFREIPLEAVDSLLAYGYLDAEGLQAYVTPAPQREAHTPAATTWRMLQTTSKMAMRATRAPGGVKVETMAFYPHNGAAQLFRRTARDGGTPPFPGVPAETLYMTHLDLIDLQQVGSLLSQLKAEGPPDGLVQGLEQFRRRTGADLERDVLPIFTGAIGLGITSSPGPQGGRAMPLPGIFLTLGVRDEQKAMQLIQSVGTKTGGPMFTQLFQSAAYDGHDIRSVANPLLPVKPGYVISRKQLIVASDKDLLQHMLDAASGRTPPLVQTDAYRQLFKQFRIKGGSMTFLDLAMALEKAKTWWAQIGFLAKAFGQYDADKMPPQLAGADPWMLTELLRPIRYVASMSQGETQGVRTEALITLEDIK